MRACSPVWRATTTCWSRSRDVARTYVVIRTFQERLRIAAQNVRAQRASLQLADVRFREGAATELDVQQGKALLFGTEATIRCS